MRQFLQSAIGGRGAAGPNTSHGLDTATGSDAKSDIRKGQMQKVTL